MFCAPARAANPEVTGSCFRSQALYKIAKSYNRKYKNNPIKLDQTPKQIWAQLRRNLSHLCQDEWCWIDQDFVRELQDPEIDRFTFRPEQPVGQHAWLSTDNIDEVMTQYEAMYPEFIFIGPVPMDFAQVTPELMNPQLQGFANNHKTKIGIIFNMDPSHKRGSHWVAMFIDFSRPRNASIDYFDSFGKCPPPLEIRRLIQHLQGQIELLRPGTNRQFSVNCNNYRHQFANSECGIYTMHFIVQRLKGQSFRTISENIIRDEVMNQHRSTFFRPPGQK
jgi:hypothetical protein